MQRDQVIPHGAEFAYGVGRQELADQLRRIEALDSKAGILLAAGGVLAGFVFGSRTFIRQAPGSISLSVALFVTASLVLALIAFGNQKYRTAPLTEDAVRLMVQDENWLKWRFLGNLLHAIQANSTKLEQKARFSYSCSLVAATCGSSRHRIFVLRSSDRGDLEWNR